MTKIGAPSPALRFELDDLSRQPVRNLVAHHLDGMHAQSPPENGEGVDALRRALGVHAGEVTGHKIPDGLAGKVIAGSPPPEVGG